MFFFDDAWAQEEKRDVTAREMTIRDNLFGLMPTIMKRIKRGG